MSKTPFMPLWVADFINKTTDLDARETGAYLMLIMALWTHGGTLPNDARKLQRIARCGREWPRVWAAIEGYFDVSDDSISQPRVTEELQKVNTKRKVNAHNGARGGRAKALKYNNQHVANATNSPKRNPSIPEPESYSSASNETGVADVRDDLWNRGVAWLVSKQVPERQARSQLGKWLRDHGPEKVRDAFNAARESKTGDPVPYIEKALRPKAVDIRKIMDQVVKEGRL